MLTNTYTLTVGTAEPITLTRVREDGGSSKYVYRAADVNVTLNFRQDVRTNKAAGTTSAVFNASLIYETADTVDVLGKTYSASFTGSVEDFGDPAFGSDLNKALHTLAAPIMAQLATGEV